MDIKKVIDNLLLFILIMTVATAAYKGHYQDVKVYAYCPETQTIYIPKQLNPNTININQLTWTKTNQTLNQVQPHK